jgi:parallel beta-helix repeat protein
MTRNTAVLTAASWALALAALPAGSASAADAFVPGDFPTIAAAISGASDLDSSGTVEISVLPGTYSENLFIRRSNLRLEGASPATTTIRGSGAVDTIRIEDASNVTLTGFTVTSAGGSDGVELSDATGCTIEGNVFTGQIRGISLGRSSSNTVTSNEVHGNVGTGIKVARLSNGNVVAMNLVHDNGNHGIDVIGAADNLVQANTCASNRGNGIRAGKLLGNVISENVISGSGDNGIRVGRTFDLVVTGNTATGSVENGLRMDETTRTIVLGNEFTGNREFGVRRKEWIDDDFSAAAGAQDPAGDNDLSGNSRGPVRND